MSTAPSPAPGVATLLPGDHVPWFQAPALSGSPSYAFQTVAGRHIAMLFFGSARFGPSQAALRLVADNRGLFDDRAACFFGVTVDPEDEAQGRIEQALPGIRYFLDYDRSVSILYGALGGAVGGGNVNYHPFWLIVDPSLRVVERFPIERGADAIALLARLAAAEPEPAWAPVLLVPNVLEPELCRELIDL